MSGAGMSTNCGCHLADRARAGDKNVLANQIE
jgi:hypothetical protein